MVDVRLIGAWHTFKLTSKFINHQSSIGNHQSFDSTHVEVLFAFRMVCCLAGVLEKLKLLSLGQGFLIGKKTEEGKTEDRRLEQEAQCAVRWRFFVLSCGAAVFCLAAQRSCVLRLRRSVAS